MANSMDNPGRLAPTTAVIVDLAAVRAARAAPAPATYTTGQLAHAHRIGNQMADAINSGRVSLGRNPLRGTIEEEEALTRRLEWAVAQLQMRRPGRT